MRQEPGSRDPPSLQLPASASHGCLGQRVRAASRAPRSVSRQIFPAKLSKHPPLCAHFEHLPEQLCSTGWRYPARWRSMSICSTSSGLVSRDSASSILVRNLPSPSRDSIDWRGYSSKSHHQRCNLVGRRAAYDGDHSQESNLNKDPAPRVCLLPDDGQCCDTRDE